MIFDAATSQAALLAAPPIAVSQTERMAFRIDCGTFPFSVSEAASAHISGAVRPDLGAACAAKSVVEMRKMPIPAAIATPV